MCAEVIRRDVEGPLAAGGRDAAGVAGSGPSAGAGDRPPYACPNAGTEKRLHANSHSRIYGLANEREARQHIVLYEILEAKRGSVHARHVCGRSVRSAPLPLHVEKSGVEANLASLG